MSVADVKITMTLGDHDRKGLASTGRRRRGCDEHTSDSVVMMRLDRVEQ